MTKPTENSRPEDRRIHSLPVERICRDPEQARTRFDDEAIDELADSIRQSGVIQPVVVTGNADQGYRLLAGERRWRAAQRAGLARMPAVIRNDLDSGQARVLGLIENLQRESLSVMDTARGLATLSNSQSLTHGEVASRIGKSRVYVSNFLRLLELDPQLQAMLDERQLTIGHGKVLAGLDAAAQRRLAKRVVAEGASVRRLESWVRRDRDESDRRRPSQQGGDLAGLERRLSERLGNAVRIRYDPARRRGELQVAFHDLDEFEGLLRHLGVSGDGEEDD